MATWNMNIYKDIFYINFFNCIFHAQTEKKNPEYCKEFLQMDFHL